MDSVPIHSEDDLSFERNKALIKDLLDSGHFVELPALGNSMYPTLKPGDRVIVRPLEKGEIPKPGQVVVFENNNVFVIHRLMEMIDGSSGEQLFISRGDCGMEPDNPWPKKKFIGVAISYSRSLKKHSMITYLPGVLQYKFNILLFWLYNKVK